MRILHCSVYMDSCLLQKWSQKNLQIRNIYLKHLFLRLQRWVFFFVCDFKHRERCSKHLLFCFHWNARPCSPLHFLSPLLCFVFCFDQTYNTFGNLRCLLHLMSQQVSIASSESLNDTKLFSIRLIRVHSVAILKSGTYLSLISVLSLRNHTYLFPMGWRILSDFSFLL